MLIRSQTFKTLKCYTHTPCIFVFVSINTPQKPDGKVTVQRELMKRMLVELGDGGQDRAVCRTQDTGQRSADDIPFVWRGG